MSGDFKFKFDEMQGDDPAKKDQPHEPDNRARNICFVQLNGKMIFLNYGYLIAGEYAPEESMIILSFTSHNIMLKGVKLEPLFVELMLHLPRNIICTDVRYNQVEGDKAIVNVMDIKKI